MDLDDYNIVSIYSNRLQCRLMNCNKHTTLVKDFDKGKDIQVWGQEVHETFLYLLPFAVNLKLLLKNEVLGGWDVKDLNRPFSKGIQSVNKHMKKIVKTSLVITEMQSKPFHTSQQDCNLKNGK